MDAGARPRLNGVGDKWVEIGLAAVMAILAFFGKRELSRKDDDVREAMRRLDNHIRECKEQHDKVADTLLKISTSVARIEGRLSGE
jgi:hypothetical protein